MSKEKSYCPICDGPLCVRDSRNRRLINDEGSLDIYRIKRLRCTSYNKIHTELPNFMMPFKHYRSAVIEGSIDGTMKHCPSDGSTMHRWKVWMKLRREELTLALESLRSQIEGIHIPLLHSFSLLDKVINTGTGWLALAVKLLINSGLWSPPVCVCAINGSCYTLHKKVEGSVTMRKQTPDQAPTERMMMIMPLLEEGLSREDLIQRKKEICVKYDISYRTVGRYLEAYTVSGFEGLKPIYL